MYAIVKLNKISEISRRSEDCHRLVKIGKDSGVMCFEEGDKERIKVLGETHYIEDPFTIEFKGDFKQIKSTLPKEILFVYIGKVDADVSGYNTYNLDTQMFETANGIQNIYIAYSSKSAIDSIQYLTFIIDMMQKAMEQNKKLVIYADLETKEHTLKYRSLLGKIINELLSEMGGVIIYRLYAEMKNYYIPSPNAFEPYIEYAIYTYDDFETAILKVSYLLQEGYEYFYIRKAYRQQEMLLYDNIFYKQIPDEEKIYVPILGTSRLLDEEYREMGLEYINLIGAGGILKGSKKAFDQVAVLLKRYVVPEYTPEILTHPDIRTYPVPKDVNVQPRQDQLYNGEGVYIGVIGASGIDYEDLNFWESNEKSRIVYAWNQLDGNKGVDYKGEDIKKAMEERMPLPIYSNNQATIEKIILEIAGGRIKLSEREYKSTASKTQFMYAKIKSASSILQEIYGGTPDDEAVLLEDVIIAIDKLVHKAIEDNKPLVLCIPFGSNLGGHDGESDLERKIGEYAMLPGITLLTSTGEEADKMHHSNVDNEPESTITLKISQPNQKVVGQIWFNCLKNKEFTLHVPGWVNSYSLDREGTYVEEDCQILIAKSSRGYPTGRKNIMFSLKNPRVGDWKIEIKIKESNHSNNLVDIWLAAQELNAYSTLFKSDVFVTLPSIANGRQILCVGDFDNSTDTSYKSSGRGYTSQSIIKPTLVAQGTELWHWNEQEGEKFATGSLVAMANIAGVAAAAYSKVIAEQVIPVPNTLVITSILVSHLYQLETMDYPNKSQGNGIFNRKSLNCLLDANNTF